MKIEIRICPTANEFKKKYGDLIDAHEAELQLFSLNLTDSSNGAFMGAVYCNNEPCTLFLNAYPYNLQLFENKRSTDAVTALAEYIVKNGISIAGVQGRKYTAEAFIKAYRELDAKQFITFFDMSVLSLTDPIKPDVTGSLYRAQQSDAQKVTEYIKAFNGELRTAAEAKRLDAQKIALDLIENESAYIYSVNGAFVGMAATQKRGKHGMTVSQVYIDKQYRGRGYAKAMMYLLCTRLLKNNEYVTLFVNNMNAAACKVYADVGFKFVANNVDCRIV